MSICLLINTSVNPLGPLHGNWGPWSGYGRCTFERQMRSRSCNDPQPDVGGMLCLKKGNSGIRGSREVELRHCDKGSCESGII